MNTFRLTSKFQVRIVDVRCGLGGVELAGGRIGPGSRLIGRVLYTGGGLGEAGVGVGGVGGGLGGVELAEGVEGGEALEGGPVGGGEVGGEGLGGLLGLGGA